MAKVGASGSVRRRAGRAAMAALLAAVLVGCGGSGSGPDASAPAADEATTAPTTSPAPTVPAPTGTHAQVYFLRSGMLIAAGRQLPPEDLAASALDELLAGPIQDPRPNHSDNAMESSIPAGTVARSLSVADGTATVGLSDEFLRDAADDAAIRRRLGQVTYTLTALDGIERVVVRVEGAAPPLGPSDAGGWTRSDFVDLLGPYLVEVPTPHQVIARPIRVQGSTTVTGPVAYAVTQGDGDVLAEGEIDAVDGADGRRTFDVSIDVGDATGDAALYLGTPADVDARAPESFRQPITLR